MDETKTSRAKNKLARKESTMRPKGNHVQVFCHTTHQYQAAVMAYNERGEPFVSLDLGTFRTEQEADAACAEYIGKTQATT